MQGDLTILAFRPAKEVTGMYTSVSVSRELASPVKALLLCWIAACVLLGVAGKAVALSDNFNDGSINPLLWVAQGYKGGIGGIGAGSWQYSLTEVPATDGYLQARVWGPTSGNTFGAEAWVRTTTNFNDGRPWVINFAWDTSVSSWHVDNFAVQIADGTNTDTCNWHQYAQNNVGPGWLNLWETGSTRSGGDYLDSDQPFAPFSKQTWSVKIDPVGTASLYQSANGQGAPYRQVSLDKDNPWYLRYLLNDATSAGFPGGDNSFKLYDFSAEAQIPPPPKTYGVFVGSTETIRGWPVYNGILDAKRIEECFGRFSSYEWGLGVEYKYKDPNASTSDIFEALSNIERDIGPGDTFIFFCASHGCGGTGVDEDVSLAEDAIIVDDELTAWFKSTELVNGRKRSDIWADVNKLFIFDSCHSGGFGTSDDDTGIESDLMGLSRAAILAACTEEDVTSTLPPNGLGMFTWQLSRALGMNFGFCVADRDRNGLTFDELEDYLDRAYAEQGEYDGYITQTDRFGVSRW